MGELPKIEVDPGEMARLAHELWERMRDQGPEDKGDEGLTKDEYAELWGVSPAVAKKRLRNMRKAGLMIKGSAFRRWTAGHWQRKPVYRPKEEA